MNLKAIVEMATKRHKKLKRSGLEDGDGDKVHSSAG